MKTAWLGCPLGPCQAAPVSCLSNSSENILTPLHKVWKMKEKTHPTHNPPPDTTASA